jgi:hypothetical protein
MTENVTRLKLKPDPTDLIFKNVVPPPNDGFVSYLSKKEPKKDTPHDCLISVLFRSGR